MMRHLSLLGLILIQTTAYAATPAPKEASATKLTCSGSYTLFMSDIREVSVAGVYVTIGRGNVSIYNVPRFSDVRQGTVYRIDYTNPSKVVFKDMKDSNVSGVINRMDGSIWLQRDMPDHSRLHSMFQGKCVNSKPIF